ncbi:MAG TPA: DinB family protein [Lacunisphaera sp.]|nr:DinB family protein [Lacunisphaera sp.]
MNAAPASPPPRLAPPGAGLPPVELFIARRLFRWHGLTTSRAAAAAQVEAEREAIVALARGCTPAAAARPVLIPRLRGMEDSSRHWSVYMTVEHVRIVNAGITGLLQLLPAGRTPPRAASTAAVKPAPGVDGAVVAAFVRGCADLAAAAAAVPDLHAGARYAHPWFGPLDAAGWHVLAGFHLRLHRRQIEAIVARLG